MKKCSGNAGLFSTELESGYRTMLPYVATIVLVCFYLFIIQEGQTTQATFPLKLNSTSVQFFLRIKQAFCVNKQEMRTSEYLRALNV